MKMIEKAVSFSAVAHDGQYRKGLSLPYFSHPVTVGFYLLEAGASEEVIAAGILHDVVEDTATTYEMVKKEFGQVIADLVIGCSEPDKSLSWEERKTHTINALRRASFPVKQIACADKLHNLTTIKSDYEKEGEQVWVRFNRGKEKQRWYYESVYTSLVANLSDAESSFSLFSKLKNLIDAVFED
ncbi:HD domain-containing protein [Bacillus sp. RAR_GA_16]|uniref:HD domain-containing protein n=1 Tax=Bacillus sp. RAR_GA_16 TaxID=2876774 RepID=UPI001CCD6B03|nr:HD domain-containing protein [Bacillus sp. RAR_GA_16]MCA0171449.1 HD domain-containing protein [Bacillus sp. RAR_GA_16]